MKSYLDYEFQLIVLTLVKVEHWGNITGGCGCYIDDLLGLMIMNSLKHRAFNNMSPAKITGF
ncbi:hypothetical protein AZH43_08550 [Acinetobacter pragensis]|uniref:Uncharacterized protein n=1 Tax=Acinetobacter pragensis TaxID=1806892 RepID=A0A151Y4D5_9GAMM|nr:hypothetical protein AZH43_08550 [Acinetobacter pragensis]